MQPETKREIVTLLTRAVAHLYAIAGALAARREWSADERAAELVRVLEMLKRAYDQLAPLPDCAASVLEQCMIVRSVQVAALDDVQSAMALARAGLVINTWCTASTMLVSTQATDGPQTIGGLLQIVGTMQPDPRYQAAVAEKLAAVAYDNSAARQLGTCYFQAHEGFSLLELHCLLSMGDTAHAADLFDNASRGALTAVRFLERKPLDQAEAEEAEADDSDGARAETEEADRDGARAETDDDGPADDRVDRDRGLADDHDRARAGDQVEADSDGAQVEADDRDGAQAEADDRDDARADETDQADDRPSAPTVKAARDPPASAEAVPVELVAEEIPGA